MSKSLFALREEREAKELQEQIVRACASFASAHSGKTIAYDDPASAKAEAQCPECHRQREVFACESVYILGACGPCEQAARKRDLGRWRQQAIDSWLGQLTTRFGKRHMAIRVDLVNSVKNLLDKDHPALGAYLCGPSGTGKTQQAIEAMRHLYRQKVRDYDHEDIARLGERGVPLLPRYIAVNEGHLLATLRPGDDQIKPEYYATAPWLALDDVGISKGSDWTFGELYQIINYRYNECLPTLFTSNVPLSELVGKGAYDERLVGRIMQMCGAPRDWSQVEELTTDWRLAGVQQW